MNTMSRNAMRSLAVLSLTGAVALTLPANALAHNGSHGTAVQTTQAVPGSNSHGTSAA